MSLRRQRAIPRRERPPDSAHASPTATEHTTLSHRGRGPAERERDERLCRGDTEALVELYDDVAAQAYNWAMILTGSRRKASAVLGRVFTHAAREPQFFCDHRVPSDARIIIETYRLATTRRRQ